LTAVLIALLALLAPAEAPAQSGQPAQRIAAVVNEEVVSVRDVEARMHLVMVSSALPDSPELRQRLRPQVLRALIDERLQVQEARRVKIVVTENEIKAAFATIEEQNRLPPGGIETLFERTGIDRNTLGEQIQATIAWTKVVRLRGSATIQISEDQIDETVAEIEANRDKPEYHVSEIFLPVDTTDQEEEVRRLAERMVQQIRAGADFAAIARQFSQSGTSAAGGDVGWVRAGQMDPEVERVVIAMKPGQVSDPVRALSGLYVVALSEINIPSQSAGDTVVALRQLMLPVPAGGDGAAQMAQAAKAAETVKSCTDMDEAARDLKSPANPDIGRIKLAEMAPQLRSQVETIPVGRPTQPIKFANAVVMLMVCDRIVPRSAAPSRDDVREQITRQRLEQQARRMLRDLRRAAFVDLRG
jgi:peptidyl-prolyl cis-trans isomerase SurA